MDEFEYDFGEAFGQLPATPEAVSTYLQNEIGMKQPDLSLVMKNLYPNVEEVAMKIWNLYKEIEAI